MRDSDSHGQARVGTSNSSEEFMLCSQESQELLKIN
jgi:hypothetical protein